MNHTKRFLAAVTSIVTFLALVPMRTFADNTIVVSYDPTSTFTVTIPSGVTLDSENAVSKSVTASEVMLQSNQVVVVKLENASNTSSGSTFHAKTEVGDSTAVYSIVRGSAGSVVSVGDTVAEFTENGTQTLVFSPASGATHADVHTETLTFGISVEDTRNIVDLAELSGDYQAQDGDVLTGTYTAKNKITVANGATVTLKNANIVGEHSDSYQWAGITCEGNATLALEGENTVIGFHNNYPGIFVPENSTLIINGNGVLNASSNGDSAGIGSGNNNPCGSIEIRSGTINANGGADAAGIGSGYGASCENITISGGTVTVNCNNNGGGIGAGEVGSCGNITISGGTVTVTASSGAGIGTGNFSKSCGDITISGGTVNAVGGLFSAGIGSGYQASCGGNIIISDGIVTAAGGEFGAGIGSGAEGATCGNITISGGVVNATGGRAAAGIGSSYNNASCGDITISDTVTKVTATKGASAHDSIGTGVVSSCGTVTIGGVVGQISDSPYIYDPNA